MPTKTLLLFLGMALLAACETVVDVPAPPHVPQLAAQSFFAPDSLWVVRVTSTVPYASPAAPAFVDDAIVEIWDGDRLIARPAPADSGLYVGTGEGAAMGRTYTLRVAAPGYASVEGHDVLPPPPQVAAFREMPAQP